MDWRGFDPAYWQGRADETRAVAEGLFDQDCKMIMLRIAEGYESIARRCEASSLNNMTRDRSFQKDQEAESHQRT